MDDLLAAMLSDAGIAAPAPIAADGFVEGYVLDRPMSLRAAIEPLGAAFGFDALAAGGRLRFVRHLSKPVVTLAAGDFVEEPEEGRPALVRMQDSELPTALTLGFIESDWDYRQAAARAAVPRAPAGREAATELAAGLQRALAVHRTEVMLTAARIARESVSFALPPSRLALEPGDAVAVGAKLTASGASSTARCAASRPWRARRPSISARPCHRARRRSRRPCWRVRRSQWCSTWPLPIRAHRCCSGWR